MWSLKLETVFGVLTKNRFFVLEYNKLSSKKIGTMQIIEKSILMSIASSYIRTADMSNVDYLLPYYGDSFDDDNLRANFVHPWENDAGRIDVQACALLKKLDRTRRLRHHLWRYYYLGICFIFIFLFANFGKFLNFSSCSIWLYIVHPRVLKDGLFWD